MAESESQYLLVAAFDFGTTYSGYAFSFRDNPENIQTNQNWTAGSEKLISLKTPTCLLLSPDKKFHSFGFEAEDSYTGLAEDKEHEGWLFFRRFKMLLHNNEELSRVTTVEDINGKKMPALTIFSMSIRYLKDHLLDQLNRQTTGIEETDIRYVMTVPAIWNDNAKQFMREAAIKAGVDTNRLKLAREPEAASIWCQISTDGAKAALSGSGTKYMVIDLGGGTADISVHEKNEDGTLKELHKASGGPWGGMVVDNNYLQFLEKLFGKTAIEKLKTEELADYLDLLREFETRKRIVGFDKNELMTFRISADLKRLSEEEEDRSLEERLASLHLGDKISIKRDKMRINASVIKNWFDNPVDSVVEHAKEILAEMGTWVGSILLVGGFGESQYVQDKIEISFPAHRLLVLKEASLAVLKGAVRYGHDPSLVSARVMTLTYGISVTSKFDVSADMPFKLCFINGKAMASDRFSTFVHAGDTVPVGYEKKRYYNPIHKERTVVAIYSTAADPCPRYTTDKVCKLLGMFVVMHPEGETLEDKGFEMKLIFGETELIAKARIIKTGREFFKTIDCFN